MLRKPRRTNNLTPAMSFTVSTGPAKTLTPDKRGVLIDHQLGSAVWVRDYRPIEFENNVLGWANGRDLRHPEDPCDEPRFLTHIAGPCQSSPSCLRTLRSSDALAQSTPICGRSSARRWRQRVDARHHRRRLVQDVPAVSGAEYGRRWLRVALQSSEAPVWRVESDRPDGHPRSGAGRSRPVSQESFAARADR